MQQSYIEGAVLFVQWKVFNCYCTGDSVNGRMTVNDATIAGYHNRGPDVGQQLLMLKPKCVEGTDGF